MNRAWWNITNTSEVERGREAVYTNSDALIYPPTSHPNQTDNVGSKVSEDFWRLQIPDIDQTISSSS